MRISIRFSSLTYLHIILVLLFIWTKAQETSSLSYLDEYLVPSAKSAFTRIQETFQGSSLSSEKTHLDLLSSAPKISTSTFTSTSAPATIPVSTTLPTSTLTSVKNDQSQFSRQQNATQSNSFAREESTVLPQSSNSLVTSTSTSTAATPPEVSSSSTTPPASVQPAREVTVDSVAVEATTEEATTTTTTTTTTTAESAATASREEAAREAEQEAVQAVDASIGFGLSSDLFGVGASSSDSCYDEYGNARYCEPPFENAAFEQQVEVSSECGLDPPHRFCTAFSDQLRNCHVCNSKHPKKRHPASYLTDAHNPLEPTCWVSAPLPLTFLNSSSVADSSSSSSSLGHHNILAGVKPDNVSIQLNLNKRYEIVYVSLQFCSVKPDSLAIYKSNDNGINWQPYQFYSSNCQRTYGKSATNLKSSRYTSGIETPEAQCISASLAGGASRVAFSPLEGRSAAQSQLDRSSSLQDWISATNIRITLDRHQASWLHSLHSQHKTNSSIGNFQQPNENQNQFQNQNLNQNQNAMGQQNSMSEQQLTSPSDTFNYAVADLTVGARCKCNGHASRCVHNVNGQFQCDCRHNTAGPDCERCAPFHFDRPWARASQLDASPCQPCNCNGHSRKCVFDAELYRLSGKRSGGVCMNCRDNTAGRFCHYCKEGYTRDHSRPMSDKEACKHCDCHPIGSLGRVCNQTTGQCPCKEGVAGAQCNLCAPGYQQSSSLTEPCIKLPENDINYDIHMGTSLSATQMDPVDGMISIEGQSSQEMPSGGANSRQPEVQPISSSSDTENSNDSGVELPIDVSIGQQPPMSSSRFPNSRHSNRPMAQPGTDARRLRYPHHYQRPSSDPYATFSNPSRAVNNNQQFTHYNPELTSGPIMIGDSDQLNRETSYLAPAIPRYYSSSRNNQQQDYYRQTGGGRSGRPIGRLQPVASLDQGNQDELMLLNQDDPGNLVRPNYQHPSMIYTDQFNQILSRRLPTIQASPSASSASPSRSTSTSSARQHQFDPDLSEFSCNDCQASVKRKLTYHLFCQSKFVIKATVLNIISADDWTRVDVEIQDIFKSFGSSLFGDSFPSTQGARIPLLNESPASDSYLIDNTLQASDETRLPFNTSFSQSSIGNGVSLDQVAVAAQQPIQSSSGQRIKIGTIQTIWVPTEDITCKCPRLKIRSTYLLMGSIEARGIDGTENSLQFDRHGVALEWKPIFQGRIMKYQHRIQNGRGRCSSRI